MTDHVTSLGSISTVLIGEFREALTNLLDVWFPRVLDREHGGFLCDFDYRWRPRGPQTKTLEFQARTLRALSEAAAFFPERPDLREMADAGAAYLRDSMWDREYGGFFRSLERSGTPLEGASKHGHGTSYVIAALVFHHRISGDEASLDLARRGFEWLDEHAHDERHGGYFGAYERDGRPILTADRAPPGFRVRDVIGTPFGLKDANTTCDLMAALASLYEASKDPAILVRVEEIFAIVLTKLVVPPGSMHMFTHPDWTPVPDYARYGQSIHSANLLRDTARQLGEEALLRAEPTIDSLIECALAYGWDGRRGGFFYGGSSFGRSYIDRDCGSLVEKYWWVQIEGMIALTHRALAESPWGGPDLKRLRRLWSYVRAEIIDERRGGWRWFGLDSVTARRLPKSTPWKDPSHEVAGLTQCIEMLELDA